MFFFQKKVPAKRYYTAGKLCAAVLQFKVQR